MRKIECMLWPEKSSQAVSELRKAGVARAALVPVEGFGPNEAAELAPRPGLRLEVVVEDAEFSRVAGLVSGGRFAGFLSDRAVVVSPVSGLVNAGADR
jgi:nitrogen regulatory protein PII